VNTLTADPPSISLIRPLAPPISTMVANPLSRLVNSLPSNVFSPSSPRARSLVVGTFPGTEDLLIRMGVAMKKVGYIAVARDMYPNDLSCFQLRGLGYAGNVTGCVVGNSNNRHVAAGTFVGEGGDPAVGVSDND
jgi:hypothetical protein